MYRFEKALKEERHLGEMKSNSPSFSSTLLDEIYRSNGCEPKRDPGRRLLHWEAPSKKQGTRGSAQVTPQPASFAEKRGSDGADPTVAGARRGHFSQELLRKPKHEPDLDSDGLYFSSTSISSDSSSGGFSFSDTESVRGAKTTTSSSCFAPFRLKPVRTRVAARGDERQRAPFGERREGQEDQGGALRSAASRIYANLKKVKQQPVSPGGRLVSFINSIFSTTPKSANRSDPAEANRERKLKSGQSSSSASAFSTVSSPSRPCLSKRSPSTRERFRSGAKRTVRFYPVSVIVDEDCRPCGHKSLHQEGGGGEKQSSSVSLTVPKAWRIGKSQPRKIDQDRSLNLKDLLMEKSRRLEENARELLRDYRENQRKGFELKGHCEKEVGEEEDDDDDDGGASCSSSDLFELDHLAAINDKYSAELPVYETTYFDKCRVSGKGYRL